MRFVPRSPTPPPPTKEKEKGRERKKNGRVLISWQQNKRRRELTLILSGPTFGKFT
jgi:hypothetical protein